MIATSHETVLGLLVLEAGDLRLTRFSWDNQDGFAQELKGGILCEQWLDTPAQGVQTITLSEPGEALRRNELASRLVGSELLGEVGFAGCRADYDQNLDEPPAPLDVPLDFVEEVVAAWAETFRSTL